LYRLFILFIQFPQQLTVFIFPRFSLSRRRRRFLSQDNDNDDDEDVLAEWDVSQPNWCSYVNLFHRDEGINIK